ncbi:MAG TPA: ABC transporter ATP-binding protein [Aggregatilineales bacterium]|nr:ABC transporter ATP-binding protein [Aggregatilineales bacterium]
MTMPTATEPALEEEQSTAPFPIPEANGNGKAVDGRKAIIDIRNITKIYHLGDVEVQALRGVSLKINSGEFVSIMGPSGSGKSTMLQILGALDQPTSGEYFLDGVDVSKLKDSQLAEIRNKKIGFVFQSFNLLARISAQRQVELPLLYAGTRNRSALAIKALEAVDLGNRVNHTPKELSGGQQQRVAIARAIVTNPAMVLADEPTGALDSRSGQEVLKIFQKLNREQKITVVFVTHDSFVAQHTDRIIMLRDGEIVADRRVANPYDAATTERPSEDQTLKQLFDQGYAPSPNGHREPVRAEVSAT